MLTEPINQDNLLTSFYSQFFLVLGVCQIKYTKIWTNLQEIPVIA
jgi:hypothetical protein